MSTFAKRAAVTVLFGARETDPKSEAKPEIWTNWDDFVAMSEAIEAVVTDATFSSTDQLGPVLGKISATCKACHADYRT